MIKISTGTVTAIKKIETVLDILKSSFNYTNHKKIMLYIKTKNSRDALGAVTS